MLSISSYTATKGSDDLLFFKISLLHGPSQYAQCFTSSELSNATTTDPHSSLKSSIFSGILVPLILIVSSTL